MKELSLEEVKKIELEILEYFSNFCEKNDLRYFLAYGTLIGAICHKGFIPWDDDIDVVMPKPDVDKLCAAFPKSGRYQLIKPTDDVARHGIIKIVDTETIKIEKNVDYTNGYLGVDIDIFTLDGEPDNYKKFLRWQKKLFRLTKLRIYTIIDIKKCRLRGKVFLTLVRPFLNYDKILKKREKLHNLYKYDDCKFVGNMENCNRGSNKVDRFLKSSFDSYVYVEFEGKQFRAPKFYDEYLRMLYGDYMQFPPKEQQVTHHSNICYCKED